MAKRSDMDQKVLETTQRDLEKEFRRQVSQLVDDESEGEDDDDDDVPAKAAAAATHKKGGARAVAPPAQNVAYRVVPGVDFERPGFVNYWVGARHPQFAQVEGGAHTRWFGVKTRAEASMVMKAMRMAKAVILTPKPVPVKRSVFLAIDRSNPEGGYGYAIAVLNDPNREQQPSATAASARRRSSLSGDRAETHEPEMFLHFQPDVDAHLATAVGRLNKPTCHRRANVKNLPKRGTRDEWHGQVISFTQDERPPVEIGVAAWARCFA